MRKHTEVHSQEILFAQLMHPATTRPLGATHLLLTLKPERKKNAWLLGPGIEALRGGRNEISSSLSGFSTVMFSSLLPSVTSKVMPRIQISSTCPQPRRHSSRQLTVPQGDRHDQEPVAARQGSIARCSRPHGKTSVGFDIALNAHCLPVDLRLADDGSTGNRRSV